MAMMETRDYRLATALRARLMGAVLAAIGVSALVVTVVVALADVPRSVVAGLVALGAVAVVVAAVALGRGWYVVRLDATGYRVRFVRGVGRAHARWTDVADVTTAVVSGTPCVVLRLRDGAASTVPVNLVEGDREEFVEELRRRLDAGHGYRPL
ncbi:hypothetical protein [Marmoricola sp. URHA0025 HA25]